MQPTAILFSALLLLGGLWIADAPSRAQAPTDWQTIPDEALERAIVQDWFAFLLDCVELRNDSPPEASRIYAYSALILYESFVPGLPEWQSLQSQLPSRFGMPPRQPDQTYSAALIATTTLAHVLREELFINVERVLPMVDERLAAHQATLRQRLDDATYQRSLLYARAFADDLIRWIQDDQYAFVTAMSRDYIIPSGEPHYWQPVGFQAAMHPYWEALRPFALTHPAYCDVPLPIPYSSEPDSAFYQAALEVYEAVNNATESQRADALYWADDPGDTSTPPGHWVALQHALVTQLDLDLAQTLEMYTLTNLAMADSFISTWESKYRYQLIRPITYVRQIIGDRTWSSIVETPPFPEYPSGHAVVSGAAATVLTHLFGEVTFHDADFSDVGFPLRTYDSFAAAAEEAALSRLYGGIHYRFASEKGLEQGACVANNTLERLTLRAGASPS